MNLIYYKLPIVCANLQPEQNLPGLAHDIEQILAIVYRGDGDTRESDVRHLNMRAMLDWVTESPLNYQWLQTLGAEICNRYAQINATRLNYENNIKGDLATCPPGMKSLPWLWSKPPELYDEEI